MSEAALVLAPFSRDALEALRGSLPVTYESWTETRRLHSPQELAHRINGEGIGILVIEADFVFDQVFQQSSNLRLLGVCRNGLNHVDIDAATEHGVAVVNTPGRNAQGVAELTVGLMLSLARGISRLDGYVRNGGWDNPVEPYISMGGVELNGKTLGIVGLGTIGRSVARLARAFGMQVLACDPYLSPPGSRRAGVLLEPLEEVLRRADFLSVHTTDTPDNKGLLDRGRLGLLKPGSYVLNTAAYHVIEEEALVQGLQSGRIAGAALDVHRSHPIPPNSPLLKLENVILTPHIGGATDGTVERQSWMMVEEIHRFLQGQRPRHLVNGEVWVRRE